MFYVVVAEQGFCYIPTVTVTDQEGIIAMGAEVIDPQTITKHTVTAMLNSDIPQAFQTLSLEEAINTAEEIYKKLPRHRRQLDFDITDPQAPAIERHGMTVRGAGTLKEEVADKYW